MQIREMSADELIRVTTNYKIPFYQRNYTWGKPEIEELIKDVLENNSRHYYLGNIVIKTEHFDKIIVDGQQRITTLLLLVKAFTTFEEIDETSLMHFNKALESTYENQVFSSSNILEKIFKDIPLSSNEQNSVYYKNYMIILELIKNQNILEIIEQYYKIQFAYIGLDDDVDEHKVFSQINSTGKKLRAFDLMKNYLFSQIDENDLELKLSELEIVTSGMSEAEKDKMLRHFNAYKTEYLVKNNVNDIYGAIKKLMNPQLN